MPVIEVPVHPGLAIQYIDGDTRPEEERTLVFCGTDPAQPGRTFVVAANQRRLMTALQALADNNVLLAMPRSRKDRFNELVATVCNGGTSDDAANVQFALESNYVRMTVLDRIGAHTLMAIVDKHRELFGEEDFFID